MTDYAAVLTANYVGKQWTLAGDDYTGLVWLSAGTKPTQIELDAQWAEVQTEIANKQTAKDVARQAVLDKLGLTADEAKTLFG